MLTFFAVKYWVNQIIIGVVLNVLVVGLTSFLYSTVLTENPELWNARQKLPNLPIPLLSDIPILGRVLFDQNILVYLMYVVVIALQIFVFRSKWGLRMRAVGEHPKAADTVGIAVNLTRWKNVLLGAAVAGLGGATLTIGTGVAFGEEMSAGKGYIALAAAEKERGPEGRIAAIFGLVGAVNLPIIHFSVEWWNTLHQGSTRMQQSVAPAMRSPLRWSIVGFLLLCATLTLMRLRTLILQQERRRPWVREMIRGGAQ